MFHIMSMGARVQNVPAIEAGTRLHLLTRTQSTHLSRLLASVNDMSLSHRLLDLGDATQYARLLADIDSACIVPRPIIEV